jgi:tripartite-type tricarboxylate transporter receptor subunit TctC
VKQESTTILSTAVRRRSLLVAMASTAATPFGVNAQQFPSKPIALVSGFPAGGGSDAIARLVGAKLAQNLGQPVVVENRPGASSIIAAQHVANAPADGYTLFNAETGALVFNGALYSRLSYDAARDFTGVSNMVRAPLLLVVHPSFPARDLKGLVELAKREPGRLNYASAGKGTAHQIAMETFKMRAGVDIGDVTYKGIGPAMQDLLAGQVPMSPADTVVTLQHVRSGKLRALAAFSNTRLPVLPDVPSMAELGYPDLDLAPFVGIVAPRKTPRAIVAQLGAEIAKAVRDPEVSKKLTDLGLEIIANTPEQFDAYLAAETQRWRPVIKTLNVRLD